MSFLLESKAIELTNSRKRPDINSLISVSTESTLEHTLNVLAEHQILSVLVQNPSTKSYEGILSIYEIMSYISWKGYDGQVPTEGDRNPLEAPASALLGTSGVEEIDKVNGLWTLNEADTIKQPLELFGKGVYRLLIETPAGPKLISQSDLAKWIQEHWEQFGPEKDATVASAGLGKKKVHAVSPNHTAVEAFRHLRTVEVQGFPVVDSQGSLIANFSASDLRGITASTLSLLSRPVLDFLASRQGGQPKTPITCTADEPIKNVLEKLLTNGLHRLWVVDADNKVISVVSLTDISLYFFSANLSIWYPPEDYKA